MKKDKKLEWIVRCYCMTRFNKDHYLKPEKYEKIYKKVLGRAIDLDIELNTSGYSKMCSILDSSSKAINEQ